MEKVDNPPTEEEMKALRQSLRTKYHTYYLLNRDRFPAFEYNTNRANYEPLRESFEEEFYNVRGMDRNNGSIHIPSTNTLARLFSEDNYVPSRKILNTCRSYAEGPSRTAVDEVKKQPVKTNLSTSWIISLGGLLLLGAIGIGIAVKRLPLTPPASGLVITRPSNGRTVPRELLTTGRVTNAKTVWLVVHAVGSVRYWVQPPISVEEDDTWRGGIYIGSDDKGDIGVKSQVRAFVNPRRPLKEGDVLSTWPESELSSEIIEVTRGR